MGVYRRLIIEFGGGGGFLGIGYDRSNVYGLVDSYVFLIEILLVDDWSKIRK